MKINSLRRTLTYHGLVSFSQLFLRLVKHPVGPASPFFGKTLEEMKQESFELIAIFEGTDDFSSSTIQACHSWLPEDIQFGYRFMEMTNTNDDGEFVIDCSKLSGNHLNVTLLNF